MLRLCRLLPFFLLACQPDTPAVPVRDERDPGDRIALLVGIERYSSVTGGAWTNLDCPRNDVQRMKNVLCGPRFGFEARDVHVLLDDAATHEAIVRAFDRWLIRRTRPGTEVVFFYAGHGSTLPDASGRERLGDASLVAYDSRRGDESFDVSDDELHSLMRAVVARGGRMTAIQDCCHSGGGFRGPGASRVRGAEPGRAAITRSRVASFWPPDVEFLDDDHPARARAPEYVHIAACRDDQQAFEADRFGALTYALTEELDKLPQTASYEQLAERVRARMVFAPQEPQFEGQLGRQVFGGSKREPLPGFSAVVVSSAVRIHAGTLHRLRRGSVLQLRDLFLRDLGLATIERLTATQAVATWDTPPTRELAANEPVRAIEIARGLSEPPLTVFVPTGSAHDDVARRVGRMTDCARVVRERGERPDFQLFFPGGSSQVQLWTANGDRVWPIDDAAAGFDELHGFLRELRDHASIMRLAQTDGDLTVELSVEPPSRELLARYERDNPDIRAVELHAAGWRGKATAVDVPGQTDMGVLRVEFPGVELGKVYVTVLALAESGKRVQLFPDPSFPGDAVRDPRKPLLVAYEVSITERWHVDRPMGDRYLAIVTSAPADFSALERPPWGQRVGAARGSRQSATALPELIERSIYQRTTRGDRLGVRRERFGVAALDLLIRQ